tara:strand:+ start:226 stop:933 length:708 start_codon:yes stop_codon:yes gene_type:complete
MSSEKNVAGKFYDVWILVPCFNEAKVISKTITGLSRYFENIIVVDDGSTDNTFDLLKPTNAFVLKHPINLGQGAAISSGFKFLSTKENCKAVITFDADGQHSVDDAVTFAKEIQYSSEDIIFGSRFICHEKNIPLLKRLVLKIVTKVSNIILKMNLTDTHNGLKAFKKDSLKSIDIQTSNYAFESELLALVGKSDLTYKELPSNIVYTEYSRKKGQSLRNGMRILESLIVLFFSR